MELILEKMAAVRNRQTVMSPEAEKQLEDSYNEYSRGILGYLSGVLYDRNDAEEVLQEIFVAYARRLPELSEDVNHKAYLLKAARNRAFSLLRSKSRRKKLLDNAEFLFMRTETSEAERNELEQKKDTLNKGLQKLSDYEREVVLLRTQNGLTIREVAELFEAPEGTVASIYRRALQNLKEMFNHE